MHGRGVYAAQFIPKGTRIIEYTGERTSWEAAPNDENDPHTFNFGLDNGKVINPEIGGNDARWINHSCDPNCETAEEDDRIFIDSMRDIQTGEELFYDYALEIDEPITEESKKKFACRCRSVPAGSGGCFVSKGFVGHSQCEGVKFLSHSFQRRRYHR